MSCRSNYHRRSGYLWGILLIAIGVLFLMDNFHWIETGPYWRYWPFLLVVFGVNKMVGFEKPGHIADGIGLIGWGFWLYACLEHVWGMSFLNSWPLVLIGVGLNIILKSILKLAMRPKEQYESSSF